MNDDTTTTREMVIRSIDETEHHLAHLRQLLVVLDGGTDVVIVPGQGIWTKIDFERLCTSVPTPLMTAENYTGINALLSVTAQADGNMVTFSDVLAVSGLDDSAQRLAHRALRTTIKNMFVGLGLPIEARQGRVETDTGRAEMRYRMDPRIARWWKEITESPKEG